jgi:hypothetical protein
MRRLHAQNAQTIRVHDQPTESRPEEESTVMAEVQQGLRDAMPWVTSLLFHLGIIVLALFVVWSVMLVKEEEPPVVASPRYTPHTGAALSTSDSVDLKASSTIRRVLTDAVASEESVNTLTATTREKLQLIGLAGGGASGGKLAPLGTTTGGPSGGSTFVGLPSGNANRIIYVVDASGSLIDTLPFVIKELSRSIGELSEEQSFTVIFFQRGREVEVPPVGWKAASAEMKKRVADFISMESGNIVPSGSTDPMPAIKRAMAYKPQLVYLLSDNITGRGRYEVDRAVLLRLIDEANRDRRTRIHTIQFLYPDPLGTLEAISREHGGLHRFIHESDVMGR